MYKVIAKFQKPDYNWEKQTFGLFDTKEEADAVHVKWSLNFQTLLTAGDIIDYQIETIERGR